MAKQKKSKGRVVDFNKALEEKEKRKKKQEEQQRAAEEPVEISEVSEAAVKRHKQKTRRRRGIYILALVVILAIFAYLAHNIITLKIEQHELEAQKQELEQKKKELKEEKKAVVDPEYIEDQARKQLKMIKPGEILYILPEDDSSKEKKNQ